MALKPEIIRRKLLHIDEAVARLRGWMPLEMADLEQDLKLQWAVERGLQVAAEALFDAGSHLLAGAFREAVDQYREIPVRLAAHSVISQDTAGRLRGLAGFRNVLVHEYAEVDLTKVHAGLQHLADFEAFIADVERWLTHRADGGGS